jgi:electron transport complex protein RnfA
LNGFLPEGLSFPLVATNCCILGFVMASMGEQSSLAEAVIFGLVSSVGFLIAMVSMAGVRERLHYSGVPQILQGYPIFLISAGLMSLAFYGLSGLFDTF